jgi:hypothetical protein
VTLVHLLEWGGAAFGPLGLIDRPHALAYFRRIEPELRRYPAINRPAVRRAVEAAFG